MTRQLESYEYVCCTEAVHVKGVDSKNIMSAVYLDLGNAYLVSFLLFSQSKAICISSHKIQTEALALGLLSTDDNKGRQNYPLGYQPVQ